MEIDDLITFLNCMHDIIFSYFTLLLLFIMVKEEMV